MDTEIPWESKRDRKEEQEKEHNDVDRTIHRLASRISRSTVVTELAEPYNDIFHPLPGSKLDPQSSSFDTRAWVKALVQYESEDLESGRRRKSGVSFRNLDVYGFGMSTDYQKTVGNSILSLLMQRRKRGVDILRGFEGLVNAGEMLLVLGPPGSGCSTLLKTIAGHMEGLFLGDKAMMNYRGVSSKEMHSYFRGEAIFAGENDVHFPMLSVGDTLSFAARARAPRQLPAGLKAQEYSMLLRDVIMAIFGISHTANTVVGNDFIRGISGGERKRVSIAEAALSDAALQCWDNSTRGLDSANAVEFCRTLRTATELLQSSVLVSLYQAPQEAYELFNNVTLLYEGRQIFFGPTSEARVYFEELGFECPEQQTTPDFLTSMTSPKERRVRPGFENKVPRTAMEFEERWKTSHQHQQLMLGIEAYESKFNLGGESRDDFMASRRAQQASGQRRKSPYTLSYMQQTSLCLWRGWKRLLSDPSLTYIQLGGNTIMALVLGSIFFNLHDDTNSFYGRGGLIFFALLLSAFASVLEILTLYEQRPVVEKHKQFALYHPSAEALASMLTDIPYKLLNTFCFNLTLYLMANLRREAGAVFFFLFVAFLSTMVTSSLFRTIASVSRTMSQALVPAALLVLGLIMYTGFTMPTMYMPGWSRWMAYVNPLSYAFESLMINEFQNREFSCSVVVPSGPDYSTVGIDNRACAEVGNTVGSTTILGNIYINDKFNYNHSNKWRNVGILIAFWFIFTATYLAATELLSMAKSKGEVLIFRRGHFVNKKSSRRMAEADDEEALGASMATMARSNDTEKTHAPPREGQIFQWQDVCYDIKNKGEFRRILDHVDGWVQPGTLTALMGVSGAGKTTLLNVLANRMTTGVVTGDMLVDGMPCDASIQRKTGYVQQQDVHLSTCSVRESLEFSALLRQPATVSRGEKLAYVKEVISLLEMEEYADAIVGIPGEGLNIEQRRRLTIGIELAAKPELLLFLDEPTSGLDSQTSWAICQLLKRLARSGQAILCTIHQPSAILFQQFDNLLLLAKGGKTVYFGEIGQNSATLTQYLEYNGGKQCPAGANPAEWMLEVIGAATGSQTTVDWPKVWRDSHEYQSVKAKLREIRTSRATIDGKLQMQPFSQLNNGTYASPFLQQWWLVQKRVAAQYWRTPSYIYSKIALTVGSSLFIGFSFYNAPNTVQGLQNQMYAVMMLLSMFGQLSEQIMPQFINQRDVYEARERPSKIYDWKVLMLSNIMIEIFWNTLMAVMAYFCWYYPIGLYQNAVSAHEVTSRGCLVFLYIWAFMMFTSTFTHILIAGMDNADSASSVGNICYMMCITFCGILVKKVSLPGFWTFMYYVSPFTWLASGLLSTGVANAEIVCAPNEYVKFLPLAGHTCGSYMAHYISLFGGYLIDPNSTEHCAFCPLSNTNDYLSTVNIQFGDRWRNLGIVLVYVVVNAVGALAMYGLVRVPKRSGR
ncbi:ABC-2 type transporter-domain-containing protein [Aspergillus alliaceus]|uniref:ABC-2 type transporter-domain-containing protein n=1 Tax=Petromyces alliaceus TaxID=209559 RepID=A0A5N7CLH7_PETAA|nr:ABC-2 type transporter-domain-containing protein [Aspergillus alliaceus]